MLTALWLMLSTLLYSLQLSTGSLLKPLITHSTQKVMEYGSGVVK